MLTGLDVKNIALIDELSLEIGDGMTVLTGETGAGKSIIIDAVNLLLGARTNKGLVRYGTERASVQGLFSGNSEVNALLTEMGIEAEDEIVVRREITAEGKSICRINGTMVPLSTMREAGTYLINIHGQQDNQALLTPSRHIDFLDKYAKCDLAEFSELYAERREIKKRMERLTQNEQERLARLDLLKYQVNELSAAKLRGGEKSDISEEKKFIENAEKISGAINEAYSALYEEGSAYDTISRAEAALSGIEGFDEKIDKIASQITDMQYMIEDYAHELKTLSDGVEYDEETLNEIEERLDLITRLERKYGGSEEAAIEYLEKAKDELELLENADETAGELSKELEKIEKKIEISAEKLSKKRRDAAKKLQSEVEAALCDLSMPKVKFEILIEKAEYGPKGADSVEFMISPNVGEPLKPLVEIASGGELSRVMLAIKSIVADGVDTLVFDEIDTGVSGGAAQKIAKRLSLLSKGKQVICISHQPQLAAAADNHYKIEKSDDGERTVTRVTLLSKEERIAELARIIDGDNITETAISHAKEMLGI